MGLFGKKNAAKPASLMAEAPPSISADDLLDATRVLDRFDASLGNSDETWDCMEAIARLGGFKGQAATITEIVNGRDAADVVQRPWRWWNEVARAAHGGGDDVLAARVFLFAYLFMNQMAPNMRVVDKADVGLDLLPEDTYRSMAQIAEGALARISPEYVIHDTATGRLDVATALSLASQVCATHSS